MKKYLIYTLALFLIISIGIFLLITNTSTYNGVIIEGGQSIWVVEGDPENINNKSKQELREIYSNQGVVFTLPTYMPDKKIDSLSVGDEVIVYYNGEVRESGPGGAEAYWVSKK